MSTTRAYGSWPSPISAEHVAAASRKIADVVIDRGARHGPRPYWIESCPDQAGRNTIMTIDAADTCVSLLDAPTSARSVVHEYGGGAFTVHAGTVWFVDAADQAIHQRDSAGRLTPITDTDTASRFADLQYDAAHRRLIAVSETAHSDREPSAAIEAIGLDGRRQTLASGHDFYASPRLAPDASRLVWLAWNHPDMPWDATELWQADINGHGAIGVPYCRWAPPDASLFQPLFAPTSRLHIVCDADDWWNIYQETDPGATDAGAFIQLTHEAAEFGLPQWVFGQSTLAFTDDGRLYALATRDGFWQLGEVDRHSGGYRVLDIGADSLAQLHALGNELVLVAADALTPKQLVRVAATGQPRVLRATQGLPAGITAARPRPVTWPTDDGDHAHGLFYAPAHADYQGPADEKPPVILKCHGGPTGATSTALDARIQYWTSRGYAVLDINYRGSTGYGRAYRRKLIGRWGIAEVADCVHGAAYLAEAGAIDADRVLISGSSAGGYTVLCVLTFTRLAAAGASYYGIGDLSRLMASTHKFESRYLSRLIGDSQAELAARSPLMHAERLACPVLFLQGGQDKVVPPDQAETMAAALRARGVPVAYVYFASERHGFSQADNIITAIEAERTFYSRVLGLPGGADLAPLAIENFSNSGNI